MLEVIDKNVTEIAGQKLVPMRETEVSDLMLAGQLAPNAEYADRIGTVDVPTRPESARQSVWWHSDAHGIVSLRLQRD